MEEGHKEDKVGYGRPPQETQFKKGKSGNPKGRPKHPTTLRECLNKVLSEFRSIKVDGKKRKVTNLETLIRQLCAASLTGNLKAMEILFKNFGDSINIYGELYPPEIRSPEGHAAANETIDIIKDIIAEKRRDGS